MPFLSAHLVCLQGAGQHAYIGEKVQAVVGTGQCIWGAAAYSLALCPYRGGMLFAAVHPHLG